MSLAIPHQFRRKESPISSTKVNENNAVIVSYINELESALTSDIYALIPAGTKMVFYQGSAPAGWTLQTSVADKFLRIVAGGGGGTGGTVAASTSLAHTHTMAHTHTIGSHTHTTPSHQHNLDYTTATYLSTSDVPTLLRSRDSSGDNVPFANPSTTGGNYSYRVYQSGTRSGDGSGTSGSGGDGSTSSASNETTTSQLGAFAYADVIVCSKD